MAAGVLLSTQLHIKEAISISKSVDFEGHWLVQGCYCSFGFCGLDFYTAWGASFLLQGFVA